MSYIDNHLLTHETVLHRTNLHWIVFTRPAFWTLLMIIFLQGDASTSFNETLAIGFFLCGIWLWLSAFVQYFTSEFGVTSQRVLIKTGFIQIDSLEVLLKKVESIQVHQSILGRILGYGSITITGTGGSQDPFSWINDPLTFRRKVQEQIELTS